MTPHQKYLLTIDTQLMAGSHGNHDTPSKKSLTVDTPSMTGSHGNHDTLSKKLARL
jgi:hypothetical protein